MSQGPRRWDEQAVSPVIAVILMVAITVVLAATVFAMTSQIDDSNTNQAPAISWHPDEAGDRMVVNTAVAAADWARLAFRVDACDVSAAAFVVLYAGSSSTAIMPNTDATSSGAPLNTGLAAARCGAPTSRSVVSTSARVLAGDYVDVCAGPAGGSETVTNVKLLARDIQANALVAQYLFTNVARCDT